MAFGNFKSVQEVSKKYQISIHAGQYLQIVPFPIDPQFERDLLFDLALVLVLPQFGRSGNTEKLAKARELGFD